MPELENPPEEKLVEDSELEEQPLPVAKKSSKEIEVVALRLGFYKQERKMEGDSFTVPSLDKVGSWMKCVDPQMEKQHLALQKQRNAVKSK